MILNFMLHPTYCFPDSRENTDFTGKLWKFNINHFIPFYGCYRGKKVTVSEF